jgi:hypothetical protein
MADHFADRYWSPIYWLGRYFQGGEVNPGSMSASLSGGGAVTGAIAVAAAAQTFTSAGRQHGSTTYAYKTLSQLAREEKARLRKIELDAKRKVAEATKGGEITEGRLAELVGAQIAAANAPWLTPDIAATLQARVLAYYAQVILKRILEDEDDAEAILLAA